MEKETDPYTTGTISTIILILRRALFVQLQLQPNNLSIKRHRNRGIPTKQPPTPANHKHHGRAEPSLYLRVDDLAVLAEGARERALRGVPRQPAHEDPSDLIFLRHPGSNQIEIPSPPAARRPPPPARGTRQPNPIRITEISHQPAPNETR